MHVRLEYLLLHMISSGKKEVKPETDKVTQQRLKDPKTFLKIYSDPPSPHLPSRYLWFQDFIDLVFRQMRSDGLTSRPTPRFMEIYQTARILYRRRRTKEIDWQSQQPIRAQNKVCSLKKKEERKTALKKAGKQQDSEM